ncbi:MAG: prepilin-type N-terminal cleavage/methylation domain-containing protein [Deltaproteobacteria bacterium]|nr:prepilin-type N-terminal cleavage/methylation domain-containing protein [Deltaproteobacteria bacterium]
MNNVLLSNTENRNGFTLIELLVVLVIVGLMSAMVAPRLTGLLENLNLKTTAKKTAAALRYARAQAISEGKIISATFDFEAGKMQLHEKHPDTEPASDEIKAQNITVGTRQIQLIFPREVKLEKIVALQKKVTDGTYPIYFYPTGATSGADIHITGKNNKRLVVSVQLITGSVQVRG